MKLGDFASLAGTLAVVFSAASATALAESVRIERALVLRFEGGASAIAAPRAKAVESLPELDPLGLEPQANETARLAPGLGVATWSEDGLGGSTLAWRVVYVAIDRFAEVSVEVKAEGETTVWVDGAKQAGKANWRRGKHTVAVRTTGAVSAFEIVAPDAAKLELSLDPSRELADYRETKAFGSISDVVISDDGRFVAFLAKEASAAGNATRRLEVYDALEGRRAPIGLLSAPIPLSFTSGNDLLVRQGDDAYLVRRATGEVIEVLRGESGLGALALARDASFVVYSSGRGAPAAKKDGPKRRRDLREKLSDWPTSPHLFVAAIGGGSKRRLTLPGDCTHDAFTLYPDDRRLLWTRSIAIDERPWFETEFHELDLVSGNDRIVTTLRMGVENRPGVSELRVSGDGQRVAFLAPRSELGDRAEIEPNVFDPDLWVLELETGEAENLTLASSVSPDAHLAWSRDGSRLYFVGVEKAVSAFYSASRKGDAWEILSEPGAPFLGAAGSVAIARDGAVAGVFSLPDRFPELSVWHPEFGKGAMRVVAPNDSIAARRRLLAPERFSSFEGERRFDAWLYRPTALATAEKVPLVVHYYGGATPTMFGFSDLHQFLAANGYAVLVVNPRGCGGYGDEWSRAHVADWGEIAGADIVAALDRALELEPKLDGSKVGCYGGSYGGFMTLWLAARYPDRFHAAVSMYGISNLVSYFGEGQWGYSYGDQAMANKYPWRDEEYFVKHSPLFHAEHVNAAVLLLHGEIDSNVTITESEQMFTALDLLGKEVELVRFPGEDHGLRGTTDNRIAHREMIVDWFDRHLRGQPEAWNARF